MERKELVVAVTTIMTGIERSGSALGMDYMIFQNFWLRSMKDFISVSLPFETGIECAVKAEELQKILSKMEGDQIKIALIGEKLQIKDGRTTLNMSILSDDTFQQLSARMGNLYPSPEEIDWKVLPDDFSDGLELSFYSAGTEASLGPYEGVHFDTQQFMSTDNKRVSVYKCASKLPFTFTLPTEAVGDLLKLHCGLTHVADSKSWIHFLCDNGLIASARRKMDDYPLNTVAGIFDKKMEFAKANEVYSFPVGLERSIDRAEVLCSQDESFSYKDFIHLTVSKGILFIKGEREAGSIVDKIVWKENPPEGLDLQISPKFLRKIIHVTRQFKLSPVKKAILFETDNFKHLILAKIG